MTSFVKIPGERAMSWARLSCDASSKPKLYVAVVVLVTQANMTI